MGSFDLLIAPISFGSNYQFVAFLVDCYFELREELIDCLSWEDVILDVFGLLTEEVGKAGGEEFVEDRDEFDLETGAD